MQSHRKKTWKDLFRITEEEEANFDIHQSDHINIQHQRINPFNTINLNRLNNENFHTRAIGKSEI